LQLLAPENPAEIENALAAGLPVIQAEIVYCIKKNDDWRKVFGDLLARRTRRGTLWLKAGAGRGTGGGRR